MASKLTPADAVVDAHEAPIDEIGLTPEELAAVDEAQVEYQRTGVSFSPEQVRALLRAKHRPLR